MSNGVGLANYDPRTLHSAEFGVKPTPRPLVRFLKLAWQEWRLLIPAILFAIVGSICCSLQPVMFGGVSVVLAEAASFPYEIVRRRLYVRTLLAFAVYLVDIICTWSYVSLLVKVADRTTRLLREQVFDRILQNDVGFYDEAGRFEIERVLATEIGSVRESLWRNVSRDRGLRSFLEFTFSMILCFRIVGLAGIPVYGVFMPVLTILVARKGLRSGKIASDVMLKESGIQFFVNERLRGLRTLKAFGAENKEKRALNKLLDDSEKQVRVFGFGKASAEAALRSSITFSIIGFFLTVGALVAAGKLKYAVFASVSGYIWNFSMAIQGISFSLADIGKISNGLKNIYSLLDKAQNYCRNTAIQVLAPSQLPSTFRGEVKFENVKFYYPSRPDTLVLNEINFSIQPGQMIALVGESGGGKSTIAAMLSRFYAAASGRVTLDGIDIQSLPSDVYAKQLSVVDQEPIVFQGTIRENIAYGLPDEEVNEEAIVRAAKEANAHDFIVQLQDGYDTVWTPASNLSGGQRQRIAIARCLVKAPRILVLDEATSALDQESERMVQNALERVMKNRTVLIIAHRLSTVRSADKILYVKDGQILESGTYDELFAQADSRFRTLVQSAAKLTKERTADNI